MQLISHLSWRWVESITAVFSSTTCEQRDLVSSTETQLLLSATESETS